MELHTIIDLNKNVNGYKFTKESVKKAVEDFNKNGLSYGILKSCADVPLYSYPSSRNISDICSIIKECKLTEDMKLDVTLEISNNPKGTLVQEFLKNDIKLYPSLNIWGHLNEDNVVDDIILMSIDADTDCYYDGCELKPIEE